MVACDRMQSRRRLSDFLKIHREQEAGLKVCPKCFFDNCEQIYYHYFFRLSQKRRNEKRDYFLQQTCFFQVCGNLAKFTTKLFQTPTQKGGWYDFFLLRYYPGQRTGTVFRIFFFEVPQKRGPRGPMQLDTLTSRGLEELPDRSFLLL